MASIFDKPVALATAIWGSFNTWQVAQPVVPGTLIPYGGQNTASAPPPSSESFYVNPAPDPRILGTMTQTFCSLRPVYTPQGLQKATYDLILAQSIHPLEAVLSLAIYDVPEEDNPARTLPVTYKVLKVPEALADTRLNFRRFRFAFISADVETAGTLMDPTRGFTVRVDRANVIISPNFFQAIAE